MSILISRLYSLIVFAILAFRHSEFWQQNHVGSIGEDEGAKGAKADEEQRSGARLNDREFRRLHPEKLKYNLH